MSGTYRRTYWAITINGFDYIVSGGGPAKVLGISVTAGFDQQVIEATITVATDDGHPNIGDWIEITMGATAATATLRFAGYFMEFDYSYYPRQVGLICKSPLIRAQNFDNPNVNGTDLTGTPSGTGQTDIQMVQQILTACGLTSGYHYSVPTPGGLGRVLGKKATQYYLWSEGDDGLSAIQLIDEICKGYRTFDQMGSSGVETVRRQVSIIPSGGSPWPTFNQGDDIFEASNQVSIIASRNLFLITGYNSDTAGSNATYFPLDATLGSPVIFPSQYWYSSSLIEYGHDADRPAGEGVSCEEIANWANTEYNTPLIKTPYTTHRDDGINPGDLIAIIASAAQIGTIFAGTSVLFVQSVTNAIDEAGTYSQKIVGIRGAT